MENRNKTIILYDDMSDNRIEFVFNLSSNYVACTFFRESLEKCGNWVLEIKNQPSFIQKLKNLLNDPNGKKFVAAANILRFLSWGGSNMDFLLKGQTCKVSLSFLPYHCDEKEEYFEVTGSNVLYELLKTYSEYIHNENKKNFEKKQDHLLEVPLNNSKLLFSNPSALIEYDSETFEEETEKSQTSPTIFTTQISKGMEEVKIESTSETKNETKDIVKEVELKDHYGNILIFTINTTQQFIKCIFRGEIYNGKLLEIESFSSYKYVIQNLKDILKGDYDHAKWYGDLHFQINKDHKSCSIYLKENDEYTVESDRKIIIPYDCKEELLKIITLQYKLGFVLGGKSRRSD